MLGASRRRAAAVLAALLFVLLGSLAQLELQQPSSGISTAGCDDTNCSGSTPETKRALAKLASGTLDKAAETVASRRGLIPAGDSCGMRYPNLLPALSRGIRSRFAAASMAPSTEARFKILDTIADEEPRALWRVLLEQSEVARRAADFEHAAHSADAALRLELPAACRSDALLAKALVTADSATTLPLLLMCVEADPGNYNGWAHLAIELMGQLDRAQRAADCDATTARIIEAIVYLDRLAKTDGQLARLERLTDAAASGSSQARLLLLAMVKERTQRRDEAVETYTRLVRAAPTACSDQVRLVAATRISNLRSVPQ